jgi:hypothetical protein
LQGGILIKGRPRNSNPLLNKLAFKKLNYGFKVGPIGYEWLTRDSEIVRKCADDKQCSFAITASALHDMFDGLLEIAYNKNIEKIPKWHVSIGNLLNQPPNRYGKSSNEAFHTKRLVCIQYICLILNSVFQSRLCGASVRAYLHICRRNPDFIF